MRRPRFSNRKAIPADLLLMLKTALDPGLTPLDSRRIDSEGNQACYPQGRATQKVPL